MLGKIAGIGLVTLLTLALVGGSAYILLRPPDTPVFRTAHGPDHTGCSHGPGERRRGTLGTRSRLRGRSRRGRAPR